MTKPLSPAFSFYPKDFVSSPKVQAMTAAEAGAYLFLLCAAWVGDPQGHLPDDEELLRRIARLSPEEWQRSRALILSCFEADGHGRLYNKRLLRERARQQSYSAAQRENGKRGAAKRWRCHSDAIAKDNLPSSSASSLEHASACSSARALGDSSVNAAPDFPAAASFEFLQAWNALGAPFEHCQSLGPRVNALAACYSDAFFRDNWVAALKRMAASAFCRGGGDDGWVATVDWFLKPASVYRLMEKQFDNKPNGKPCGRVSEMNQPGKFVGHVGA